jgi:aminomuconate-semialdehyde/2-hydroxymuconate-6-semialdehyde dehydrogenase
MRGEDMDFRLFIEGEFVDGRTTFEDVDPTTGKVIGRVHEAGADEVDRAVAAAKRALHGPWGSMSIAERGALLARVADRIDERFDEFLKAEIADTGKPASWASRIDIPRGAANFRIFANQARALGSESYMQDTADGRGAVNYVQRRPLGVVGVICPWNLPLLLMTWKVAPALAAGNTVVVKPSEETPATATLLGEVMNEVGIPKGVYNVVHGFGPGSAGEAIVQHPDVSAITFTGESATGAAIMKNAADHIKEVSFELGGKNPSLVFADCDFEAAVAGTVKSVFSNCGQVCLCTERVYVERSIYERFVDELAARAAELRRGDPFDATMNMGPLISAEHRDKVASYFDLAREEGAEVVYGGKLAEMPAPYTDGFWVEPTIWTGLDESSRCIKEEVFGPVCHVTPFDTEDEAIAMANDSKYGLAAAVWTENVRRAHRVAQAVDCGIAWVNTWFLRDLRTPFGGVKASGIGREGGIYSLNFYTELKNICIKL